MFHGSKGREGFQIQYRLSGISYNLLKMKIEFSNKKDSKNCQHFIRAVKEIQKHNPKDLQRPLFLTLTQNELRLAPNLQDIHRQRVEATCLIVIKADSYSAEVDQEEQNKVYQIQSYKMLRAFKKVEAKITLLQLRKTGEGLKIYFEADNQLILSQLSIECEEAPGSWPEQPESLAEPNYELIPIGRVSESEINLLSMPEEKEDIWLQIWTGGIYFRTVEKGKYRKQSKLPLGTQTGFNFTTLKAKLKSKIFINVKGQFLLDHLYETMKKKRTTTLYIKLINDSYQENQFRYAYLLLKTHTDYGLLEKSLSCFLCEQMGEVGEQIIREELHKERQVITSSLLKREEGGVEEIKRIVLNRCGRVDEQQKLSEEAFRDRMPMGKIEEGEQTITRRFQSKY